MKSKNLQTTQWKRLLILVTMLASAGLCRFFPAASRVCCGALGAIKGGWFGAPCLATDPRNP